MADRIDSMFDIQSIEAERTKLINALKEITAEMSNVSKESKGMRETVTALRQIDAATKKLNTTTTELKANSAWRDHLKQVRDAGTAYKDLALQYGRSSDAAQKALANYKKLREETDRINQSMGNHQANVGNYKSAIEGVKGAFMALSGAIAGSTALIAASKYVIESTDALSDKWTETLIMAKESLSAVGRAIANLDFSTLSKDLVEAAKAGREYARALDQVEDATRGLKIQEKDVTIAILEQEKIWRDKTKSTAEREAASKRMKELQAGYTAAVVENTNTELEATIKLAMQRSKLSREQIVQYVTALKKDAEMLDMGNKLISQEKAIAESKIKTGDALRDWIINLGAGTKGSKEQAEVFKANFTPAQLAAYEAAKKYSNINAEMRDKLAEVIVRQKDQSAATLEQEVSMLRMDNSIAAANEKLTQHKTAYEVLTERLSTLDKSYKNQVLQGDKNAESTSKQIRIIKDQIQVIEDLNKILNEDPTKAAMRRQAGNIKMQSGELGMEFRTGFTEGLQNPTDEGLPMWDLLGFKDESEFKDWANNIRDIGIEAFGSILSNFSAAAFSDEIAKMQEELTSWHETQLSQLEERKNTGVITDKEYQAAKLKLEKDYEAKQKAAKNRENQLKKEAALYEIAINTAVAVAKTLAEYGFTPAGFAAAGLALAAGAAQAAVVASQPIPKYKLGTDNHPGGAAVVGDDGREAVVLPSGETFITPERATLTYLPAGAKVIPNINTLGGLQPMNTSTTMRAESMADEKLDKINATLKGLPITTINITETGLYSTIKRGNNVEVHLNTNVRL